MQEVEDLVNIMDWCFCGHLRESCDTCATDHRMSNRWGQMDSYLESWPQEEKDALFLDQLDEQRRPILIASSLATRAGKDAEGSPLFKCKKHSKVDCAGGCFDFAQMILREAGVWDQHLAYLAKASSIAPPSTPPTSPNLFERRFPKSRSYPSLPSGTALPPHSLTLTRPNVRLYNQLPPYAYHSDGWIFFAVVVGHPGPGMNYLIRDATGKEVPLQFVDSWEKGPQEPTGPEAEPFKNMKTGTLLCFKCPTWSLGMRGGKALSVERIDLQGIKILKCTMQELAAENTKLLSEGKGCRACGVESSACKLCGACKTRYCSAECQTKDWKEGGHKKACSTIAHLRSLDLMFRKPA